jgi:hypothetical protein
MDTRHFHVVDDHIAGTQSFHVTNLLETKACEWLTAGRVTALDVYNLEINRQWAWWHSVSFSVRLMAALKCFDPSRRNIPQMSLYLRPFILLRKVAPSNVPNGIADRMVSIVNKPPMKSFSGPIYSQIGAMVE